MNKLDFNLIKGIYRKVGNAIRDYNMISPGDRIMVGLSGGKDSLALLDLLSERKKCMPFDFELIAAHVSVKEIFYTVDLSYLKNFCNERNVSFIHQKKAIIEPEAKKKEKNICFVCSWNRRKALFQCARTHNCKKIALGHHLDDTVETLLMNLIFQGAFSAMPANLRMFNGEIELIRPLIAITEKELMAYMRIRGMGNCTLKSCPYESDSHRSGVKALISQMEKLNPAVRNSLFASLSNIQEEYLPREIVK